MSVGLGTLKTVDDVKELRIEVWADNYDADTLRLEMEDGEQYVTTGIDPTGGSGFGLEIELDRRQMQELSIIIDRFLDH